MESGCEFSRATLIAVQALQAAKAVSEKLRGFSSLDTLRNLNNEMVGFFWFFFTNTIDRLNSRDLTSSFNLTADPPYTSLFVILFLFHLCSHFLICCVTVISTLKLFIMHDNFRIPCRYICFVFLGVWLL